MNAMRTGWAAALLAAAISWNGTPAAAQLSDESFAVNARAHAHALKTAYYRLEEFILRGSTAATSWPGDTPPSSTGWLDTWTDRGLRARTAPMPACGAAIRMRSQAASRQEPGVLRLQRRADKL